MVKILHLFPKLMNLYGEYANIVILRKHLDDQGIKTSVDVKEVDDKINFGKYDFVYMGSGTESNQLVALDALLKYKDDIKKYVESNKTLLFTGNAMELLGKKIDAYQALEIFDFDVAHTEKRYTGDVIVKHQDAGYVVGYINRSSSIIPRSDSRLFDYIFMDDGVNDNKSEGFTKNKTYATHIIGPILVKNPDFLNVIIKNVAPENYDFKNIRYDYEVDSYITTLLALKDRIK